MSLIETNHYTFHTAVEIRFSDMDAFNHVNNAIYLTYCEVARARYWKEIIGWKWKELGIIVARSEVDYLFPLTIHHDLNVYVKTSRVGTSSFDMEYLLTIINNGETKIHAKAKTVCVAIDYETNKPTAIPEKYKLKMQHDITQSTM